MKTLKSLIILTLALLLGINTASAVNKDKTETRQVNTFDAIKVSTGIDLYITMGNAEEVKIVADHTIIDNIITEVKNGTLHIYQKQSNWFNWGRSKTKKVYVSVNQLQGLYASSGSDVKSENTIKGEHLEVKTSSGSDVALDVYYKNLTLDCSSGSDAKLSGKVKTFKANASSGSDINANNMETKIGRLEASSGADITARVSDELYARASSGADIQYYGNPQICDTEESSGGDIRQK